MVSDRRLTEKAGCAAEADGAGASSAAKAGGACGARLAGLACSKPGGGALLPACIPAPDHLAPSSRRLAVFDTNLIITFELGTESVQSEGASG